MYMVTSYVANLLINVIPLYYFNEIADSLGFWKAKITFIYNSYCDEGR